jgi:hypothetical protein
MAADESGRALVERVLVRPAADVTRAVWGFTNRTEIVTLGPGDRCIVAFNDAERAWECPCHGSRFAGDGSVLHGPAKKPLEPRDIGG